MGKLWHLSEATDLPQTLQSHQNFRFADVDICVDDRARVL